MMAGSIVPDKDLCGRNIVRLQSTVLHEMLTVATDIESCSREPLYTTSYLMVVFQLKHSQEINGSFSSV